MSGGARARPCTRSFSFLDSIFQKMERDRLLISVLLARSGSITPIVFLCLDKQPEVYGGYIWKPRLELLKYTFKNRTITARREVDSPAHG